MHQPTLSPESFATEFEALRPALTSFIYRLLPNRQEAEDLAQDTYLRANKALSTFKGASSLKTWLFSIGHNLAVDRLRQQQRWAEHYQDSCRTATLTSPEVQMEMGAIVQNDVQGRFDLKEHIDYCFTCLAKTLPIEQQVVLLLKEVYGFRLQDILLITQLSEGKAKHALADARQKMTNIYAKRCSLVSKQGVCYQCSELSGMLNPQADAEQEIQALKMKQAADAGAEQDHLLQLRLELVQAIDPLNAQGTTLHNYMLEHLPEHGTNPAYAPRPEHD